VVDGEVREWGLDEVSLWVDDEVVCEHCYLSERILQDGESMWVEHAELDEAVDDFVAGISNDDAGKGDAWSSLARVDEREKAEEIGAVDERGKQAEADRSVGERAIKELILSL
jgi:hypothetical protein